MDNNYFFKKVTSKLLLVIILLQETKNFNLYNKNYTQHVKTRTSNNIFNIKKVDLDESELNR